MDITNKNDTEKYLKKSQDNRLYQVYKAMIQRCYRPNCRSYKNYGGKGVKVCELWKNDFSSFAKWAIENGYTYKENVPKRERLSIDRIDVNGDYEPSNCRWITLSGNVKRATIGHTVSLETRKKISKAKKGIPLSEEWKKNLSLGGKGKGIGNKNAIQGFYIMKSLDGKEIKRFYGLKEISLYFLEKGIKVAIPAIWKCANKKEKRGSSYGYKWEYIKE